MIYVDRKLHQTPDGLVSSAAESARKRIGEIFGESNRSHLAQTRIAFDASIWISARDSLHALFNGKCAFCESLIRNVKQGDVSHFRPKQGAEGLTGESEHHYYAWLAYEWDNLLLVCQDCDRLRPQSSDGIITGKGARFPVDGPRASLLSTVDECRSFEAGTLIDPCFDMPHKHISFSYDGECIGRTPRGKLTIEIMGLNRPDLVSIRRQLYLFVEARCKELISDFSFDVPDETRYEILAEIARMISPGAAFAGTARSCVFVELLAFSRSISQLLPRLWPKISEAISPFVDFEEQRDEDGLYPIKKPHIPVVMRPGRYRGRAMLPARAMSSLSRVEISNFKGIEHLSLELAPPSSERTNAASARVLLGENAAGKSSVLEAVGLAMLGVQQIERLKLNGLSFLRRSSDWSLLGYPAEVRLYFNGETSNPATLRVDSKSGAFTGTAEVQGVVLGYGPRRFFRPSSGLTYNSEPWARLKSLFDPMATIRNPSRWLEQCRQADFDAAIRALREVLMLPDEALVSRQSDGDLQSSNVHIEVHGRSTPIGNMSEGYRTIVATAVDVIRHMLRYWPNLERAQGLVLIDELETHLHPRWKMRILQRLRDALPNVQFLVTTHDPLCLRGALDGEVTVLERGKDGVRSVSDLPNVQSLSVEQLLTSSYFGLRSTEDPALEAGLIRYTALATKPDRSPTEEEELERLRGIIHRSVSVGRTPEEQLVYESAASYLHQQRQQSSSTTASIETMARMVDVWSSIRNVEKIP